MLMISRRDMESLADPAQVLKAVERAFALYGEGKYDMPLRFSYDSGARNLLYMPCFTEGAMGTKILTVFPQNREKGLPAIDGLMLLNDPESGAPICVLDAKMLTQLRTGAVGAGMGAKALAKRDARSVCLVGCGAQGLYQLLFCCLVRPIERIALFDAYAKDLSSFVCRVREMTGVKQIDVCQSAAEAARDADILVTATTAKSPVFPDDAALFRGKCCIGIGSYKPDMREYPDALMETRPLVVADCAHALEESGDLKDPLEKGLLRAEDVRELSDLLGRYESGEGTVFYKSVGMALFDVVTARRIYELASARGAGVEVQW